MPCPKLRIVMAPGLQAELFITLSAPLVAGEEAITNGLIISKQSTCISAMFKLLSATFPVELQHLFQIALQNHLKRTPREHNTFFLHPKWRNIFSNGPDPLQKAFFRYHPNSRHGGRIDMEESSPSLWPSLQRTGLVSAARES